MAKDKNTWIIIAIIVGIVFVFGMYTQSNNPIFVISGSETVSRSASLNVMPGSTFTLTYTVNSASGSWGNSLTDSVSGGCLFPSGSSTYKTVMLSEDGLTKQITITAPASGSCLFTGDYQFGSNAVKSMSNLVININECSSGEVKCISSSQYQNCLANFKWSGALSVPAGQICLNNQLKICNTIADTNCDGAVDRTELGAIINQWIAGTTSRDNLGKAIQAWVGS